MLKVKILFLYLTSLIAVPTPIVESGVITQEQITVPSYYADSPDYSNVVTQESPVILIDGKTVNLPEMEWALPINWDIVDNKVWSRPHHDYPALDVSVPVGTPVFALRRGMVVSATANDGGACGGTVQFSTDVGQFIYCHLSQVVVQYGQVIQAGQLLGYSGGKPGSKGSGSSTVPHLHIGVIRNGRTWCPQPLVVSIANAASEPDLTNTTKCIG